MDLNMEIFFDCKNNFGQNLPIIKERTIEQRVLIILIGRS